MMSNDNSSKMMASVTTNAMSMEGSLRAIPVMSSVNEVMFAQAVRLGITDEFTPELVGFQVLSEPNLALMGLVEVLKRQTEDERIQGGTCHKNRLGFSKKHVTRGTELALKFQTGGDLVGQDITDACKIAYSYRMQLWMIACGSVPVNSLNLLR